MVTVTTERDRFLKKRANLVEIGGLSDHQSMYKYVGLDGKLSWKYFERTLHNFELIGATLNSLNDPFEGKPKFFDDLTKDRIEECCSFYSASGELCNSLDYRKALTIDDVPKAVDLALDDLFENVRILAFCRRSDSHLLWSHYANSHRGACIHFSASAFDNFDLTKGAVDYSLHRPVVPLSLPARISLAPRTRQHPMDRGALRKELYKSCFFTKPLDWAYEEEARVIYSAKTMTNVAFRQSGIFEVIIGAKCKAEDEREIERIVRDSPAKIKVRKAFIDEDTFSVGIK